MRTAIACLFLVVLTRRLSPAAAADCGPVEMDGLDFTICEVRPDREAITVFHTNASGEVYGSFSALEDAVAPRRLELAMNGGMYHADRAPVGLLIVNGERRMRVITSDGPGNFGLLPNGVFCVTATRARVIETLRYVEERPDCRFATQSGPMLVIDGALHPRFLVDSASRFIRNGVGTSADGQRVVFAISDQPVTFHEFARLFRDTLDVPQALYLDGRVSRLHAPAIGRSDLGLSMGPILAVLGNATP